MPMIVLEHRDIPLGERHGPTNWSFPSQAPREAAGAYSDADLGKWAYQRDTRTVWNLLAVNVVGLVHTPVWEQVVGDHGLVTDAYYVHYQELASAVWVIVHGLGKHPATTVVDSAGTVVHGDEVHDSLNQVTLRFSAMFAGTAYFS